MSERCEVQSMPPPSRRNMGLDILRAFAVILVLGRHMPKVPTDLPLPTRLFFAVWRRGGWVGVDLFFVLSGFLVSELLFAEYRKKGELSLPRFYVRRGWKIYPPFLLLIAATALVGIVRGRPPTGRELGSELLFLQNYLRPMWNHTWSLAVEEHFYLMLPALLAGLAWLRKGAANPFKPVVAVTAVMGLTLLIFRIVNALARDHFEFRTHVFPTHLRLDSLMFGVVIAYAYHFHQDWFRATFHGRRRRLILGGALGLLPAFVLASERSAFIWTIGFTIFYLASGALLVGVLLSEIPRVKALVALGIMGAYSYSIYLWHMPLIDWAFPLAEHLTSRKLSFLTQVPLYLVGSVALGIVMCRLIEIPTLRLRDRWFPSRTGPSPTLEGLAIGGRVEAAPDVEFKSSLLPERAT
ncbi:acyltransferase family protein [Paludisphaera mucosa]|uniref:Acyltransferase n=1 Tax=Paludisphaera mucosa TaxID=3030827 RepID=A0ABT6FGZ8_9BACT|nr:acyltransferase [Paludisphaera mucosa]MDG3006840.1 acyltransferase [Paludisphaera mucosa]